MIKGNDWTKHKLRGRVKSAHSEVANLSASSGRWIEETRRPLNTLLFDENGRVVKELRYDLDGYLSEVGSTTYDANGNQTEVVFRNRRGGLVTSLVSRYDEAGKLAGCVSTRADGLILKQRSTPTYDDAANMTAEVWLHEDGTLSRRCVYTRRPNGQLAEQMLYVYDDDEGVEEQWHSIYDDNENLVESVCFGEGRTEYKYNENGDAVEIVNFDSKDDLYSTITYSYEVDPQRNWMRRLEVFTTARSGFESRTVTYRTFEYY